MKTPKIGDLITKTELGEPVKYRIIEIDHTTRTVKMEPVSVAGYMAIGVPVKAIIEPATV